MNEENDTLVRAHLWESLHDLGGDAGFEVLHGPDKLGQHLDEDARPGTLRGPVGHRAVLQQAGEELTGVEEYK